MIKKTINYSEFCDSFSDTYKNNFTYEGKQALFNYLEELSNDIGEDIELDTVALCCEYTEYATADEAASNYFEYEGMVYDEDGGETLTVEEVEQKAIEFLEYRTQVITFEGGVIIQDF